MTSTRQAVLDVARDGFAVLGGLFTDDDLAQLQAEMEDVQRRAAQGELGQRHAGDVFQAAFDGDRPPYVHYVSAVTELSAAADAAFHHPDILAVVRGVLGDHAYLWEYDGHGAVYQDARPGLGMTYTRIGWHTDAQSRPSSDIWPGVAITFHLDATSPANGFLRVLPGSHLGGTDGMPPGFEKVPGEIGIYCDRGDILFHHSGLWHSAARATEDPPLGVRRHVRGTFLGGRRLGPDEELEPFNKNAAR